MRIKFVLALCFLAIIIVSKGYVFYLEKQLAKVKVEIEKTMKDLNLLKIEWAYLNQPTRLKKLSEQFLPEWHQMKSEQLDFLTRKTVKNEI